MSDDSFIREVDEELRRDQLSGLWARYGKLAIALAVLVVLATAGYRGWEYWADRQAGQSGDAFLKAVELSKAGKNDEATAALEKLAADGSGEYPALARLRLAGEAQKKGDKEAALKAFDAIAADKSYDQAFRSVAQLRAGVLAVDLESHDQVKARLSSFATAGHSYRAVAREALGLAAWKAGANEEAANWFRQIVEDANVTGGGRDRATVMLELLAGKGATGAS